MVDNTLCLTGKHAVVTGAGSGIGLACAQTLAGLGASVGLIGRDLESITEACETLGGHGKRHEVVVADVKSASELEAAMSKLTVAWPDIDILVVNAGINGVWAPLQQLRVEEWEETLGTNLTGTFLTIKAAWSRLTKPGASIVIVSSINGSRIFNTPGASAYACSKAGQVALAKMAALELASDGIRVNVVCPGSIDTNIDQSTVKRDTKKLLPKVQLPEGHIPLTKGEAGSASQVAALVAFLASPLANHITGAEIVIDGAESLL